MIDTLKLHQGRLRQLKNKNMKKVTIWDLQYFMDIKKVRAEDGRITLKIDENVSRIVKLIF